MKHGVSIEPWGRARRPVRAEPLVASSAKSNMFDFALDATSGSARTGRLALPHGSIETPCFMPVGTQGTVRALSPYDLRAAGASLVLANTSHLHVRPAEDVK